MPTPLFGITAEAARIGMDALAMRQLVAAQNIAQANVAGARALQVSFATQLKAAARTGERDMQWVRGIQEAVAGARMEAAPAGHAGLEAQTVELAEVAMHYQAVARALGRHFAVMSLAVSGGRRS